MRLTYKLGDLSYTINKQFQIFDEKAKKFIDTKLSLVRNLLKGDGYQFCSTLEDYRRSFIALHFTQDLEEEKNMRPVRMGKRK